MSKLAARTTRSRKNRKAHLNIASLFSGIGGFELGLARGGHRVSLQCEVDSAAKSVLEQKFPEARLVADISELRSLPLNTDLVCAGFPCQNLSMAGDKSGIAGPESGLVDHVFRLLDKQEVRWVLFENVYFMLHLDGGKAMEHIVGNLERRGMRWAYRVLNTFWFGLPQRRRRVFLVASRDHDPRDVILSDDTSSTKLPLPRLGSPIGFFWTEGRSGVGLTHDAIPPLKSGSGLGIASPPAVLFPDGSVSTPTIREAERLQGIPPDWTIAAEKVNGRLRWRLVGNAVSVPIAEWIGGKLAHPKIYDGTRDTPLGAEDPWPSSAWGDKHGRFKSSAGQNPTGHNEPSLARFAVHPWNPLSQRALAGFVARARSSNLRFPEGFLDALGSRLGKLNKAS